MISERKMLVSVDEVVDALGGSAALRDLAGLETLQAVGQYRARGVFPPKFYVVMIEALRSRGFDAPVSLWQMVEGPEHGSAGSPKAA